MGSINPTKKRDYGKHTRIDTNQFLSDCLLEGSFRHSEKELIDAVRAAGELAKVWRRI